MKAAPIEATAFGTRTIIDTFVAAGVVWRWLLSPATGEGAVGLNQLFQYMGMPWLQSSWWSAGQFNMAAMAIPAIWQLSGYVMALFLSGFRGISLDQREAARVDGATEWKLYQIGRAHV